VTRLILALLAAYKRILSPLFGSRCRFDPSCSDYARVAIARFGAARGWRCGDWRAASHCATVVQIPFHRHSLSGERRMSRHRDYCRFLDIHRRRTRRVEGWR
jgi:putative component of membrane protein insertase Oxa1/YidC/SpoIIIJ protein YidD